MVGQNAVESVLNFLESKRDSAGYVRLKGPEVRKYCTCNSYGIISFYRALNILLRKRAVRLKKIHKGYYRFIPKNEKIEYNQPRDESRRRKEHKGRSK